MYYIHTLSPNMGQWVVRDEQGRVETGSPKWRGEDIYIYIYIIYIYGHLGKIFRIWCIIRRLRNCSKEVLEFEVCYLEFEFFSRNSSNWKCMHRIRGIFEAVLGASRSFEIFSRIPRKDVEFKIQYLEIEIEYIAL